MQKYHCYVFDTEKRVFKGEFEKMYANEDIQGFDSWHQDDLSTLFVSLSLSVNCFLDARSFVTIKLGLNLIVCSKSKSMLLKPPNANTLNLPG